MSDPPRIEALEGRTAGFVTRMLAYLLDLVIITIILGSGSWLAVQTDDLITDLTGDDTYLGVTAVTVFAILTPFIIVTYYVLFWSLGGKTPGKALLGVRIVGVDGYPPRVGRSLLRFVGYIISMVVFFLGFLWIVVDRQRRGWHDHIAGTWVVYDWAKRRPGEIYEELTERDAAKAKRR